jgi:hypothetical protein
MEIRLRILLHDISPTAGSHCDLLVSGASAAFLSLFVVKGSVMYRSHRLLQSLHKRQGQGQEHSEIVIAYLQAAINSSEFLSDVKPLRSFYRGNVVSIPSFPYPYDSHHPA